jgi:hypothetical protein
LASIDLLRGLNGRPLLTLGHPEMIKGTTKLRIDLVRFRGATKVFTQRV